MAWRKEEFETTREPKDGDPVQYAAIYILSVRELGIPPEKIKFYLREPEEGGQDEEGKRN